MTRNGTTAAGDDSVLSPGASDAGSASSSTVPASSRAARGGEGSRMSNSSGSSSRRIGSLQGAGLSSLNLAAGSEAGPSIGPSLAGFNAISTLLNDPRKPQRPIDPSSSRYPAISQSTTDLPKVKRSDYDATIQSVRAEWDRYKHSTALGIRGKAKFDGSENDGVQDTVVPDDEASVRALGSKRLPPLSTVPQVFFAEDFDMGNPYTFDLVTERYKAAASSASSEQRDGAPLMGYDVALNQMLQEKMSYYSDVVEQHLILEISARSTSFFAALGNLQDLEAESRSCLDKVEELKEELQERDEGVAKAGLRIIQEQAHRREIAERLEAVGLLNQLCEKRDLCQLLIQNSEWSEALDVMANLASLIGGSERLTGRFADVSSMQPHVDIDVASIPAIQAMAPQLNEMRESIASQLEVELLSILAADVKARVQVTETMTEVKSLEDLKVPAIETDETSTGEENAKGTEIPSRLGDEEKPLADQLHAHILGLLRTGSVDRVLNGYRDELLRAVRAILRKSLKSNEDAGQNSEWLNDLATLLEDDEAASGRPDATLGVGGAQAASRLRDMPLPIFLRLLEPLLGALLQFVRATDAQRRVVVKLLDEQGRTLLGDANDKEGEDSLELIMPPGVSPSLPANMNGIVSDVCSLAHTLASRLLSLRSSAHATLPLEDFLRVFQLSWSFVLASEAICGRMIIGLRGVILNQAKTWLSAFHRKRIEKAAKAVEEEQWAPTEVPSMTQARIKQIVESATQDPQELVVSKETNGDSSQHEEETYAKTLQIDDKQYWVVSASLDVLRLLVDYLGVIINLPLLTTDIMGRVVEFLKQFNSRTCQVVLGAGAMRSAGLKNITARHLALASQSLSVMITLVPYIREAIRRHLNPRQAVMLVEFDKLKGDYQEHQNEIHAKLVAIMSDRLTVHCRSLSSLDWSAPLGKADDDKDDSSAAPVKPIADLIRETTVLHKRLCTYLQPSVVEQIIGQVLVSTDQRIGSELARVEGHDDNMKARVGVIPLALKDSYGNLRFVTWSSKAIDESVEELQRREPPPPPPAPAPAPAEAEKIKSPTLPPAYKPRLNIFARRNQQQNQAGSPVANGRPSTDSQAARTEDPPAINSPKKTDGEANADAKNSPTTEQHVSAPVEDKELSSNLAAAVAPNAETAESVGSASPRQSGQADLADLPPPTPEKDHRGKEFADAKDEDPVESPTSPPRTPEKSHAALPQIQTKTSDAATAKSDQPRTATARSSAPPASATPARMTLQQRLAEAARKRAQASAASSAGSNASRPATPQQTQSQDSPVERAGTPTSAPPFVSTTPQATAATEKANEARDDDESKVADEKASEAATPAEVNVANGAKDAAKQADDEKKEADAPSSDRMEAEAAVPESKEEDKAVAKSVVQTTSEIQPSKLMAVAEALSTPSTTNEAPPASLDDVLKASGKNPNGDDVEPPREDGVVSAAPSEDATSGSTAHSTDQTAVKDLNTKDEAGKRAVEENIASIPEQNAASKSTAASADQAEVDDPNTKDEGSGKAGEENIASTSVILAAEPDNEAKTPTKEGPASAEEAPSTANLKKEDDKKAADPAMAEEQSKTAVTTTADKDRASKQSATVEKLEISDPVSESSTDTPGPTPSTATKGEAGSPNDAATPVGDDEDNDEDAEEGSSSPAPGTAGATGSTDGKKSKNAAKKARQKAKKKAQAGKA